MTNYEKIMKTILSFKGRNYKIAFSFINCSCQYLQTIIPLCFYNNTLLFLKLIPFYYDFHNHICQDPNPQPSHLLKNLGTQLTSSLFITILPSSWEILKATWTTHPKSWPFNPSQLFISSDLLFGHSLFQTLDLVIPEIIPIFILLF